MKHFLFNPFLRFAGAKAILIGLPIMLLSALIGYFQRCHFDGAIDVHIGAEQPMWFYFFEVGVDWACLSLFFYFAALIVSKSKIRFIDFVGTTALARFPMLFVALFAFLPSNLKPENIHDIKANDILFIIVTLSFSIWMIALLYNAYTVSSNTKGAKATVSFIAAFIAAEVVSKFIILKVY